MMDEDDIRPWETREMAAQRLRCELAGARVSYWLAAWLRALQRDEKFNPSQPRVPAGQRTMDKW